MTTNNFDAQTALDSYYPDRTSNARARLWSIEKAVHVAAALGYINFFEGAGTDPTGLPGYANNKLWLNVDAGVTSSVGVLRAYSGSGDETLVANWPAADIAAYLRMWSVYSKSEVDAIVLSGLPSLTSDNFSNASSVSGATISDAFDTLLASVTANTSNMIQNSEKGTANGVATLDANAKLTPSQIPDSILSPFQYQGTWDASTNTPTLADGVGTKGHVYRVSVAGTTSLDGNASWSVGDELYFDGTKWDAFSSTQTTSSGQNTLADLDERVLGFAKVNGHGAEDWRCHWTQNSIVFYGNNAAIGYDPAGGNWGRFIVPWDSSNGSIVDIYAGIDYILIRTDQATGNLWHMGATGYGQGGMGATSGTVLLPTQITKFVTDSVKITDVVTEANRGNSGSFWFAKTSTGNIYSCGYSGAQHVMGYNNTANLSTPRKMTYGDGTTAIANVSSIHCDTAHAPVWIVLTSGEALRWGAGTDGAHGNNNTTVMAWPEALTTAPGSGVVRTDISQIAVSGGSVTVTHAATWLLTTAGKVECAGGHDYGIGDGAAFGATDAVTFQPASGAFASKTTTKLISGGGSTPNCIAITSDGNGYIVGYMAAGLRGDGLTANLNEFSAFVGLPAGFAGALTDAVSAGGYNVSPYHLVYLEATVSNVKKLAACGYDGYYQTANGTIGVPVASRTYKEIVGGHDSIANWQSVGGEAIYGIEVLDVNGVLWYAGANNQGQSGTQPGNQHSVPYLQPCASGARVAKPFNHLGAYSSITTYYYNDVVTDSGSSWVCKTETTGNAPPSLPTTENTYWRVVAEKGETGPQGPPSGREILTSNRTYYVNATTGADSNDGLTAGTAFLTVQAAVDACYKIDANGYTVTIQLADGTYNTGPSLIVDRPVFGARELVIQGNSSNHSAVVLSAQYGNDTVKVSNPGVIVRLRNVRLDNANNNRLVRCSSSALLYYEGIVFGPTTNTHITVDTGATISITGNYDIAGNASIHIYLNNGGKVSGGGATVTLTGVPAFTTAFISSWGLSSYVVWGMTWNGSATGKRYSVGTLSQINTYGKGANHFPGDVAGTVTNGGYYS